VNALTPIPQFPPNPDLRVNKMRDLENSLTLHPPLPPLHHTLSVNTLLIHKADTVAEGSGWDSSPLMEAACKGHLEVVKLLLSSGADIHHKDKIGVTALHWAARWGHLEVVKELMKNGARVEADNDGRTPKDFATSDVKTFLQSSRR
jgi:ankyrin repeat protein